MAKYVDGFLIPIKSENLNVTRKSPGKRARFGKEHGALEYMEAAGDDLEVEKMVSFKKSADTKDGETVIFAFIVFESREERDRINALVMEDETMKEMMKEMMKPDAAETFDYTRMAYGGFKSITEL